MATDHAIAEEVRNRNDIVDVISATVRLNRAGANYSGLCPFHSEKTPSFTVFPQSQNFYCFGCGAGGDVLTFVMRSENVDFPSALEILARRAGITLTQNQYDNRMAERRRRILAMNREAAQFFHQKLMEGGAGLSYLTENRKLSLPVIRHFGLGFAPDSFNELTGFLRQKGYTDEEMTDGYLAGKSKTTGRIYDLFRNRVMFPIIDVTGSVIAFGGRVMDDSKPKYLNSSDTPVFHKSRVLYSLNYAKAKASEGLILCEGYMDVIALHAAGITTAVATLGTAITAEHARLFKRYTDRVTICYDADEAGQRAAQKAFCILEQAGLESKLLRVTDAKDPDEYLKKFGADRFRNLLGTSVSRFDFETERILKKYHVENLDERVQALNELTDYIATVSSKVEQELYLVRIAQKMEISPDTLRRDVERKSGRQARKERADRTKALMQMTQGMGDRLNPEKIKNHRAAAAEEAILGILMCRPEMIRSVSSENPSLTPDDFQTALNRRIFEQMLAATENGTFSETVLGESLTVDEIGYLTRLRLARTALQRNIEASFEECIKTLKMSKKQEDLEDIINAKRKQENI